MDIWNTPPLPIRQTTTIASFKKGVRELLDENVLSFFNYHYYYYFIDCFFLYISPYAFLHF